MSSLGPQFEVPQVSLQRYLDLLKRRRWQVIPGSLLGLLIGGLVAFLIPRYYVAETVISHSRVPGDPASGPMEDPMAEQVDAARLTIPNAVAETLRQLRWPEYAGLGAYQAREFERDVRGRVEVNDDKPSKTRSYAQLRITYRDQQGQRSADFVNRLVQAWIQKQLQTMRQGAAAALGAANVRAEAAVRSFEAAGADLRNLEIEHGLQPGLTPQDQALLKQDAERQRAALQKELGELRTADEILLTDLESLRARLDRTQRTVPAGSLADVDPTSLAGQLMVQIVMARRAVEEVHGVAHPLGPMRQEQIKRWTRQLRELQGLDGESDEMPNPAYRALQDRIAEQEAEQRATRAGIERLTKALSDHAARQERLIKAYGEHRNLEARLKESEQNRATAQAEVDLRHRILGQLTNERPITLVREAIVPPRPTEPNVLIVAFLGCAIGLGAAIGLILLVDMMQGTYKTVEDVERGLPVPVLGGLAHLESEEHRARTVRGRRRVSLVAGTVLVLVLAVVTIYYVDPTRLPSFARDLLAMVLGG